MNDDFLNECAPLELIGLNARLLAPMAHNLALDTVHKTVRALLANLHPDRGCDDCYFKAVLGVKDQLDKNPKILRRWIREAVSPEPTTDDDPSDYLRQRCRSLEEECERLRESGQRVQDQFAAYVTSNSPHTVRGFSGAILLEKYLGRNRLTTEQRRLSVERGVVCGINGKPCLNRVLVGTTGKIDSVVAGHIVSQTYIVPTKPEELGSTAHFDLATFLRSLEAGLRPSDRKADVFLIGHARKVNDQGQDFWTVEGKVLKLEPASP